MAGPGPGLSMGMTHLFSPTSPQSLQVHAVVSTRSPRLPGWEYRVTGTPSNFLGCVHTAVNSNEILPLIEVSLCAAVPLRVLLYFSKPQVAAVTQQPTYLTGLVAVVDDQSLAGRWATTYGAKP